VSKPETSTLQTIQAALAPTQSGDEEMQLKRTTVLSGNFVKKGALTGRGRAASENV